MKKVFGVALMGAFLGDRAIPARPQLWLIG